MLAVNNDVYDYKVKFWHYNILTGNNFDLILILRTTNHFSAKCPMFTISNLHPLILLFFFVLGMYMNELVPTGWFVVTSKKAGADYNVATYTKKRVN